MSYSDRPGGTGRKDRESKDIAAPTETGSGPHSDWDSVGPESGTGPHGGGSSIGPQSGERG